MVRVRGQEAAESRTFRFVSGSGTVACVLAVIAGGAWLGILYLWARVDADLDISQPGPVALACILVVLVAWASLRTRVVTGPDGLVVVNPLSRPQAFTIDGSWRADRVESWIYQLGMSDGGVLRLMSPYGGSVKVVATVTVPRDHALYLELLAWLGNRGASIDPVLVTKGRRGV